MIYIGTKKQKNEIGDYIDELDTEIYSNRGTPEHILKLQKKREDIQRILDKGYGMIDLKGKR